jgi:hypothetical protein
VGRWHAFSQGCGKKQTIMKEILVLFGVFALGYVFTMGLVFALLKLFFPFQSAERNEAENSVTIVKVNRSANRASSRLRKVRLANG